ncbi:TPA: hypothetical protein ACH3X1_016749 [Trebouxia sp. C0004]
MAHVAGGAKPSVLNCLGGDDLMYSPSKETVASQLSYSCGRRMVIATHEAMHDSQNLCDKSICSVDRIAARPGERNGISNIGSSTASTSEQPSTASSNVVDRIATVILDTHAESSCEVAHNDLTHASPPTNGNGVPELEGCFEHASTVRVPAANSQSKSPSMQSCVRS